MQPTVEQGPDHVVAEAREPSLEEVLAVPVASGERVETGSEQQFMRPFPCMECSEHHAYLFPVAEFAEGGDDERVLRQIEILACARLADILLISIFIDMVENDDIPALGVSGGKVIRAEMSHVYHDVALRLDDVVGAADDVVCVVRAHIVPRVDEMRPARTEETDALFEPAYHVGVFAVPAYYFFRPLEVYDVIRRV